MTDVILNPALIESVNPHWHDLAADWENLYKPVDRTPASAREILRGLAATQDDVKNTTRIL